MPVRALGGRVPAAQRLKQAVPDIKDRETLPSAECRKPTTTPVIRPVVLFYALITTLRLIHRLCHHKGYPRPDSCSHQMTASAGVTGEADRPQFSPERNHACSVGGPRIETDAATSMRA